MQDILQWNNALCKKTHAQLNKYRAGQVLMSENPTGSCALLTCTQYLTIYNEAQPASNDQV